MKSVRYLFIATLLLALASCKSKDVEYDASGVFEATEVIVSAQSSGEIKKLTLGEGEVLAINQQVGYIDTMQLSLKYLQLEASLSGVKSRKSDLPTQVAALKAQIANQEREHKRFSNLVASDAANQKQVDDIESQILVLQKQLKALHENIHNSNASLSNEQRAVLAQMDQIQDQINKARIISPIQGTVLAKYAEQGEFAMPGKALFKMADLQTVYLRAYVTADQLTTVKLGQKVKVYSDLGAEGRKEHQGKVTWIADKAEFTPKTIQTRDERANLVYAVKIEVQNDGFIKKGMYGEVKF